MILDVTTAIVEGAMGEGDHQEGIHIDHRLAHAQGHLLFAEVIVCLQGGDHPVMSVGERDMEEEGGLDLGATRCGRVDQGRGPFLNLARGRDRTLRIQDTVEAGQGQPAEGGGVSAILGIAGRDRRLEFFLNMYIYISSHNFVIEVKTLKKQYTDYESNH